MWDLSRTWHRNSCHWDAILGSLEASFKLSEYGIRPGVEERISCTHDADSSRGLGQGTSVAHTLCYIRLWCGAKLTLQTIFFLRALFLPATVGIPGRWSHFKRWQSGSEWPLSMRGYSHFKIAGNSSSSSSPSPFRRFFLMG